jgi:hypothetical protein
MNGREEFADLKFGVVLENRDRKFWARAAVYRKVCSTQISDLDLGGCARLRTLASCESPNTYHDALQQLWGEVTDVKKAEEIGQMGTVMLNRPVCYIG